MALSMDRDLLLGCALLLVIVYIGVFKKSELIRPLLIAAGLAVAWTFLAREEYGYNAPVTVIYSVNLYALFAWTLSMLLSYQIYKLLHRRFPVKKLWAKLLLYNSFYLPLLILFETVAYYNLGIVNLATAQYSGLPICNCLHAPHWMQLSYILMGSVYMILVYVSYRIGDRKHM